MAATPERDGGGGCLEIVRGGELRYCEEGRSLRGGLITGPMRTGHLNTPMHVVELPDGMGIGIDAWLLLPKPFRNNVVQRFGGSAGSDRPYRA